MLQSDSWQRFLVPRRRAAELERAAGAPSLTGESVALMARRATAERFAVCTFATL
jgi:hypothetical protein